MVDYAKAIPMYVNPVWTFQGVHPSFAIIIHKTAGFTTAEDVAAYFQRGSDGNDVSVHYVVGQDGTIVQCVPEVDGAGGNGVLTAGHDPIWDKPPVSGQNPNLFTISIEHVDPAPDNSTPLTAVQKEASFALVKDIATRHNIDNYHIFGHLSIDPVERARCPGNYPWDELWAYLNSTPTTIPPPKEQPPMTNIPNGWQQRNGVLSNPWNGFVVRAGFEQHILNSPDWGAWNVPLENEVYLEHVEYGNLGLGPGTRQIFNGKMLIWLKNENKVEESWIGQELKHALLVAKLP